jgi:hypothetical protein
VAVVVALAVPEAAVIVLVPAETPVSNPLFDTVATEGVALDQHTVVPVQLVPPVKVSGFPLLSVPAAVNCWVSLTLTVGSGGSITMLETVGFVKNPVQLILRARAASAAKAPAAQNLLFLDAIVIENSSAGQSGSGFRDRDYQPRLGDSDLPSELDSNPRFLHSSPAKNCSRSKFSPNSNQYFGATPRTSVGNALPG